MKTKDWLAFIGLSLAWGTSFFWIKIALEEVGPFLLVAYRIFFGLLALAIVLVWTRPQWPRQRSSYIAMLILGLTNTAIPFVLFSWAELHVDSAVASIFNSSMPLFTMVIAHFALSDDRLTRPRVLGLLVGFVGVVVLALRDTGGDVRMNLLAQGALLLAVLFYAGSTVFARQRTKGIVPTVQAFVPLIVADAVIWTAAQAVEAPLQVPQLPMTWVALLWMGIVGSCMAYLFYYYLLHSVGPTRLAMVTYMFPVVGVTMGVLFLGERLDLSLVIGAILVLLSLYIVNRAPKA